MSLATDWDAAAPIATRPGPNLSAEWDKAKPMDFKPPAAKAAPKSAVPERASTALMEGAMNMGTGMIAKPVSDIAGLAATGKEMLSPTPGGGDPAGFKRSVQEGLTYEPKTRGGSAVAQYNPMALLGRLLGWGGEKAGQLVAPPGSAPVRTAIGQGVEEAVPQAVGLAGARVGGGKAKPAEIPKDVQVLMDRDIPMTPGQVSPKLSRAEQAMSSWPLIGAPIKEARGRGVEALNRAAWNDSLKAAGEKELPATVKTGNEASQYVREKLGDRYDDLLGKMVGRLDGTPAPKNALPAPGQLGQAPKPTLRQELDGLLDLAKQDGGLRSTEMRQLRRIVDKEIKDRFDKAGTAPGDSLKAIQETLRNEETAFRQGGPYERKLADAIKEADAAVRRMVRESNPKQAAELDKIDAGYARFKIAQRAAGTVGAKEGAFKPSGYDRAVQVSDRSKDHARYSEGRALQQDLSGAGKRVLSDDLPNSGTPDRMLMAELASQWYKNPATAAAYTAGAIPAHILYSPMGIRMMQSLLTNPPNMRAAAGPMMMGGGQLGAGMLPPPPQQ